MRRKLAVALLVTGMTVGMAPAAFAPTAVESVGGHWAGFAVGPENRGPFTLDVASQNGRRFQGEIRGIIVADGVPVKGTISESGEMSMVGKSSQVRNLTVEGAIIDDNKRGLFEGRYGITLSDGTHDKGDVVAVHQVPDTDAPSFEGAWEGTARASDGSGGTFEASFSQDRGGALDGSLTWHPPINYRFDVMGQAFADDQRSGLLFVGGSDDALVLADLDFTTSEGGPHLEGSYRMVREVDPAPAKAEEGSLTLVPNSEGPAS